MSTGIVNALIAASFLTIGIRAVTYSVRRARRLPSAPDTSRTANRYLREKGDETP